MDWTKEIDEALDRITGSVNEFSTMAAGDREQTIRNAMCHQAKLMLATYLGENKSSLRYTAELMGGTFVLVLVERIPELEPWLGFEVAALQSESQHAHYVDAVIDGDGRVMLSGANDWGLVRFVGVDQIDWTEEAWDQYIAHTQAEIDLLSSKLSAMKSATPSPSADPKQVLYGKRLSAAIKDNGINIVNLEGKVRFSPVFLNHILNGKVYVPNYVRRDIRESIGLGYDEWMRPIKKGDD